MKHLTVLTMFLLAVLPVSAQTCPDGNHPHAIDLGLRSGTKWACCNVGASSPTAYGGYYEPGEAGDAAGSEWGGQWRIPTKAQFQELRDTCSSEWTTVDGVGGLRFTGPNGRSVFLPAAGGRNSISLYDAGSGGDYWSGTPAEGSTDNAYRLLFHPRDVFVSYFNHRRYDGHSVRPVMP